jgi:hypothetical protein
MTGHFCRRRYYFCGRIPTEMWDVLEGIGVGRDG